MNAAGTNVQGMPTTAEDRFHYLDAKKIVVVDDAFDQPTPEQVEDEFANFLSAVAETPEAATALELLSNSKLNEVKALDEELIDKLWRIKWEDSPLAEICRTTVFADAVDKLSNVRPFCDHLRSRGFQLIEVGQNGEIPRDDIALVLMDYVLGPEDRGATEVETLNLRAQAIETAEAAVKQFYHSFPRGADKPFIVLMSSRQPADVLVEQFEKNSELLRGMFDFVTKADLCRPATLEFKLRTWNYALPTRHDIQHFAEALRDAMDDVREKFREALRQLSFQDYTYLQSLALQDDGHPLGDYMLWLYSSFLGDLLLGQPAVIEQRERLDAMEFPAVLPTEDPPSTQLAELYQTAVGSPSEPLNAHPREGSADPTQPAPAPMAHLGDVFVKDADDPIFMVLNAACDLAFAPHTSRTCDPEQAIIMIPGRLTPLYEAPDDMKLPRTEIFAHEKKLFRVIWRDDRVFTIPYKDLFERMKESGHERRYRLRLPYALLVQQSFASRLTRIGLPVAPPICVAVDVHAHCADDHGNARLLCPPVKGGAFVIHRKLKNEFVQEFVLTAKCVHTIVDHLDDVAEQQMRVPPVPIRPIKKQDGTVDEERQRAAEAKQQAAEEARLRKKVALIKGYKEQYGFWFSLVTTPRPLPPPGQAIVLADGVLTLYRGATLGGAWTKRPYVALNIQYGAPAESLQTSVVVTASEASEAATVAIETPLGDTLTTPADRHDMPQKALASKGESPATQPTRPDADAASKESAEGSAP